MRAMEIREGNFILSKKIGESVLRLIISNKATREEIETKMEEMLQFFWENISNSICLDMFSDTTLQCVKDSIHKINTRNLEALDYKSGAKRTLLLKLNSSINTHFKPVRILTFDTFSIA